MSEREGLTTAKPCPSWQKSSQILSHPGKVFAVLILLLTCQFSIIPTLTSKVVFDTIPIWVVFLCVTRSAKSALFWTCITAAFLETHTSVPQGLYFLSYIALAAVVIVFKDHISWKFIFPWGVVIFLSYLWIVISESIAITALNESYFDFVDVLTKCGIRILVGLIMGISFANYLILRKRETLEYQ